MLLSQFLFFLQKEGVWKYHINHDKNGQSVVVCLPQLVNHFGSTPQHAANDYRKVSNIRHQNPKLKCFSFRVAVVFVPSTEAGCQSENEDVVGAAPTTSGWTWMELPTKVRLILEI